MTIRYWNHELFASEAGVAGVVALLRRAPSLRTLDFACTGLRAAGLAALAERLPEGLGLGKLGLSGSWTPVE